MGMEEVDLKVIGLGHPLDQIANNQHKKQRLSFPKFASFKPRPTPEDVHSTLVKHEKTIKHSQAESNERNQLRRHRHHYHHHEDRHTRHRSHQDLHEERHKVESNEEKAHTLVESSSKVGDTPQLFTIDRKGDVHNLTYGTIHRYNIPLYRRTGYGNVLGLPNTLKIDRDASDASKLRIVPEDPSLKRRDKQSLAKTRPHDSRILRIRPEVVAQDTKSVLNLDFIELSSQQRRKRRRLDNGQVDRDDSSSDEERSHYRSIEGKAKYHGNSDRDTELLHSASESDIGDNAVLQSDEQDRKHLAELAQRTEADPRNVQAWIDLVNYQDHVLGLGSVNPRRDPTNAEKRGLADVKLSIYEKAISRVGHQPDRERLLLGLMDEASKLWDTKKLANRWREILRDNASFIGLWIKYIEFQQSNFITFTYDNCRSLFSDCLGMIGTAPDTAEKKNIQVYIFLRMTVFMREAGFSEHATALWQSMLEFNFFRPSDLGNSSDGGISAFGAFWDSEVARIGEKNAKGWMNSPGTDVDPQVDNDVEGLTETRFFERWAAAERQRARESLLPARTLDEVTEDDPFRVILFSDIREYLFHCSGKFSQELLVNAFTLFCQIAPLPTNDPTISLGVGSWWLDPFLRNEIFLREGTGLDSWMPPRPNVEAFLPSLPEASEGEARRDSQFDRFPIPHFQVDRSSLFNNDNFCFSWWDSAASRQTHAIDEIWVLRSLQQLVEARLADIGLAEYVLALKLQRQPVEARKYAKALLKKRQSHLLLYNAYALIECRNGDFTGAEKAWSMALSMAKTLPHEQQINVIHLWRSWIWECLRRGHTSKALQLLLACSDVNVEAANLLREDPVLSSPSSAQILKSQRFLTIGRDDMISQQCAHEALASIDCLALLGYFTNGHDISATLGIYQKGLAAASASHASNLVLTELIHQARARFLHLHATTTRHYKPAIIRGKLVESISIFPSNTVFLSLYAWNESRFRIDDRVRSITRSLISGGQGRESLIGYAFNIFTELHRGVAAGSTTYSVRAAFEKAATSAVGRCSATLWKLFLLFEIDFGSAARAKEVFYRGMRACPWAKDYYMLAFTRLRESMTFEELQKVYRVMVEKELRIHVDLEEAFERREERLALQRKGTDRALLLPDDQSSAEEG